MVCRWTLFHFNLLSYTQVQRNLQIKDTLEQTLLSFVRRLSSCGQNETIGRQNPGPQACVLCRETAYFGASTIGDFSVFQLYRMSSFFSLQQVVCSGGFQGWWRVHLSSGLSEVTSRGVLVFVFTARIKLTDVNGIIFI